jgi:hypothetical protein
VCSARRSAGQCLTSTTSRSSAFSVAMGYIMFTGKEDAIFEEWSTTLTKELARVMDGVREEDSARMDRMKM